MEKRNSAFQIFFKTVEGLLPATAMPGQTILQAAHANGVPLEGACEGSLACSTCHVVCDKSIFDPQEVSDRENDLLDLAYGVKPTSRLGCQIVLDRRMENKIFEIPRCTRNLSVDGYRPPIH